MKMDKWIVIDDELRLCIWIAWRLSASATHTVGRQALVASIHDGGEHHANYN